MTSAQVDIVVIGAGPAGALAALRAGYLGARTALVARAAFGGMAGNDGPVPVRTLAHAARLIRDARQLGQYGVAVSEPVLVYPRLLARVHEVVNDVRAHSSLRQQIDSLGVTVHEQAGAARFADPHTIVTEAGLRLQADKIVICTGGVSRRLPLPGFELTSTHSDAWGLTSVPPSMLVIGAGNTGVQVASIFNAFGSRVQLFEAGDITGRLMLVPEAIQDGFVAATNAVQGTTMPRGDHVSPAGSFTDPEYAQVGLTEAMARQIHDVVTAAVHFDSTTRTIIDGRKFGFCKLIADRKTYRILGCHVVGERAVEIAQVAAIATAAGMRVDDLARVPLSYPTYAGILARVASSAARQLNLEVSWQAHQVESTWHILGERQKSREQP